MQACARGSAYGPAEGAGGLGASDLALVMGSESQTFSSGGEVGASRGSEFCPNIHPPLLRPPEVTGFLAQVRIPRL